MINPVKAQGSVGTPLTPEQKKLKEVAQEFEALFLETMLKQARSANRLLSGEQSGQMGRDIYEGWQDQHLAKAMVTGGGIGVAEALYRQLQQQQLNKGEQE